MGAGTTPERATQLARVTALLDLVDGDADKLLTLALRFLYRNPNVTSVLVGSKNADHVRGTSRCSNSSLMRT